MAAPRRNAEQSLLASAVARYRRAAKRYNNVFASPCPDHIAADAGKRLGLARTELLEALHAVCGPSRPSSLGLALEEGEPLAVVVAGTLVVLSKPVDGEPTLSLIPLSQVVDLG